MRPRLLAVALALLSAFAAAGEQPDMQKALDQLMGDSKEEATEAVESILANSRRAPTAQLLFAALAAHGFGRLEDAGVLAYSGQLRATYDLARFPPARNDERGPRAGIESLRGEVGQTVKFDCMLQPQLFRRVIGRLAEWSPSMPEDYDPGWEHFTPAPEEEAMRAFSTSRSELLAGLREHAALLDDPDYLAAFKTVIEFYRAAPTEQQDTARIAAKDAADQTMLAIEREKGLKGVFARR